MNSSSGPFLTSSLSTQTQKTIVCSLVTLGILEAQFQKTLEDLIWLSALIGTPSFESQNTSINPDKSRNSLKSRNGKEGYLYTEPGFRERPVNFTDPTGMWKLVNGSWQAEAQDASYNSSSHSWNYSNGEKTSDYNPKKEYARDSNNKIITLYPGTDLTILGNNKIRVNGYTMGVSVNPTSSLAGGGAGDIQDALMRSLQQSFNGDFGLDSYNQGMEMFQTGKPLMGSGYMFTFLLEAGVDTLAVKYILSKLSGAFSNNPQGLTNTANQVASTGRTTAINLAEQLAMKQVVSNPGAGRILPIVMNDTKNGWRAVDGWVKMSQNVNGVEVHYIRNTVTGIVTDFKFK